MTATRPICPRCKRSSGLCIEAASGWKWSRGEWRPLHEPEVGAGHAACDLCEWDGDQEDLDWT